MSKVDCYSDSFLLLKGSKCFCKNLYFQLETNCILEVPGVVTGLDKRFQAMDSSSRLGDFLKKFPQCIFVSQIFRGTFLNNLRLTGGAELSLPGFFP